MATVKELFANAGVENAELMAGIEGLLTIAESKKSDGIPYSRFKEKVSEANEAKAYLIELQTKYEKAVKTIDSNKETLKELKLVKDEFDGYKVKQLEASTGEFEKIVKGLTVEETDPKFDTYNKVLSEFTLATEESPLTAEQIKSNLTIYKYAKDFGGLELKEKPEDNPNAKGGKHDPAKSAFDTFLNEGD